MNFRALLGGKEGNRIVMGWLIVIGFFGVLFCFIFKVAPQDNDILLLLIGQLAAKFSTVIDWNYGSSKGSADKTDLLAEHIKKMEGE